MSAAAPKAAASKFLAALAGAAMEAPYSIPGLGLECVMVVVGSQRMLEIESEVGKTMRALGIEQSPLTQEKWELLRAVLTLAEACRDGHAAAGRPADPIGTREEWGELPPNTIAAAWQRYSDLCEEHDPMVAGQLQLTAEEARDIGMAIEKKNRALLIYFGAAKLSAYLLITASQPRTSQIGESSSGDASSDT